MITLTVDTDGTSGDYSSLDAAITSLGSALTDNTTIECAASSGVADTTPVVLTNLDTTTSYRLTIKPAAGQEHNGLWNDSVYRLVVGDSTAIDINRTEGYYYNITIDGLQLQKTAQSANYDKLFRITVVRHCDIVVSGNIFRYSNNSSYRARVIEVAPNPTYGDTVTTIVNNLIYDVQRTPTNVANSVFYIDPPTGPCYIYNNTSIGGSRFIYAPSEELDCLAINNLADCADEFVNSNISASSDYNATTVSTATGGANDRVTQTFTFIDAANDDYHLDSSDTGALDHGTDLSADASYAFSDDIDGDTRSGTWDIGADEYQSTATSDAVLAMMTMNQFSGGM